MAIKSSDQISIVDLTDGYSVILTNDSFTFPGSISSANAGSTTTTVIAMCGASQVAASVDLNAITKPSGVTVTKDSNATQPTLTISVDTTVTNGGIVDIPVSLDNGSITIHKLFTFAIAFTGATGAAGTNGTSATWYTGTKITGTSTTATAFSGSGITAAKIGDMYLNTSTSNVYRCTVAGAASAAKWVYTSNIKGQTGTTGASGSKWYTGTQVNGTGSSPITTDISNTQYVYVNDMYLNTSTGNTYRCVAPSAAAGGGSGGTQWAYTGSIKGVQGDTGPAGADAITMSITSSGGTIFKNTAVSTTLTAHVYMAGVEVTGDDLTALGTIKWYKDGSSTALATTGPTLTISAGDVTNKATYIAQLETT